MQFEKLLFGGDLRSIGESNYVARSVQDQNDFDELFKCLFHKDRIVVMRAADAIEKVTISHPSYLAKHKKALLKISRIAKNKELKWHIASLLARISLSEEELRIIWRMLTGWASDKNESKFVRINATEALYQIMLREKRFYQIFDSLIGKIENENIPSLKARVKKIKLKRSGEK